MQVIDETILTDHGERWHVLVLPDEHAHPSDYDHHPGITSWMRGDWSYVTVSVEGVDRPGQASLSGVEYGELGNGVHVGLTELLNNEVQQHTDEDGVEHGVTLIDALIEQIMRERAR